MRLKNRINIDRLDREAPQWRHLLPSYRVRSECPQWDQDNTVYFLVRQTLGALCLSVPIILLAPLLASPYVVALASLVGVGSITLALMTARSERTLVLDIAFFVLLCIPMVYLFALARLHPWLYLVCAAVGLFFLLRLVDDIVHTYLFWRTADPMHTPQDREERHRRYARDPTRRMAILWRAWTHLRTILPGLSMAERHRVHDALGVPPELRAYHRDAILLGLFYLVLLAMPLGPYQPLSILLLPLLVMLIRVRLLAGVPLGLIWRRTTDALTVWYRYNPNAVEGPLLFQSPSGDYKARLRRSMFVMIVLCFTVLPAARYFPVAYPLLPDAAGEPVRASGSLRNLENPYGYRQLERDPYIVTTYWFVSHLHFADPYDQRAGLSFLRQAASKGQSGMFVCLSEYRSLWPLVFITRFLDTADVSIFLVLLSGLLGTMVFPILALATTSALLGVPLLETADRSIRDADSQDAPCQATPWERHLANITGADDAMLRDHLFLGQDEQTDMPIIFPRARLVEHAFIAGDTGSGKTSLCLMSLLTQLIRRSDGGIVIIDLKGDNALFQCVRGEAQRAGLTFKHFTSEIGRSTYAFNPLNQFDPTRVSYGQLAENILQGVDVFHGIDYGRSFFYRMARFWLSATLRKKKDLRTFRDLLTEAREVMNFDNRNKQKKGGKQDDSQEIFFVLDSLAHIPQINVPANEDSDVARNAIYMPDVIAHNQVVYFWLPAAMEIVTVSEIAKLALFALRVGAHQYLQDHPTKPVHVFIDEFQHIATRNFNQILTQARQSGLGIVLSTQELSQLNAHGSDLRESILTNAYLRMFLGVTDPKQQDYLSAMSGDNDRDYYAHWFETEDQHGIPRPLEENLPFEWSRHDLIRITDDPRLGMVQFKRGSDLAQYAGYPRSARLFYTMDFKTYKDLEQTPWPAQTEETIVATRDHLPPLTDMDEPPKAKPAESRVLFRSATQDADTTASDASTQDAKALEERLSNLAAKQKRSQPKPHKPPKED